MVFLQGFLGALNVKRLKAKRNVEGLARALENPRTAGTRAAAAKALGELGQEEAVDPLTTAAYDEEAEVRLAAIGALGAVGGGSAVWALLKRARRLEINETESKAAAAALVGMGRAAVPDLASILHDEDVGPGPRRVIITVLAAIGGQEALDAIMTTLEEDGDFTTYAAAAKVLRALGNASIVERLIAVTLGDDLVRAARAADVLGGVKDDRALEPLCALLEKADGSRGETVVGALANYHDPRTVEALVQAMGREHAISRPAREVLTVWKKISLDPLIEALTHEDHKVRELALIALGDIRDPKALEPVRALLDDRDGLVRRAAERAFRLLGGRKEE